jgi:hypothetical protein
VGTRLLLADVGGACPAVWSPDSAKLAIAFGPARLAVVDVRTGDVRETPVALGRVTGMSWAPDTASLVASFRRGGCGDVVRLDAATLAATTLVHGCP